MAAADALVGEGLSISPWKEALAELEIAKTRIAELTAELASLRAELDSAKTWTMLAAQAAKEQVDAANARADKWRAKYHETRRYLRAANKGAELLSKVCQLHVHSIERLRATTKGKP